MIYYGTPQALEYDLIAQPGADPGAIRIELRGADQARLNPSGDLVISTAAGDLTMRKPRVYQDTANGHRRTIDARYRVRAAAGKRTVTLALAGPRFASASRDRPRAGLFVLSGWQWRSQRSDSGFCGSARRKLPR